ncbi:hypothetical protein [Paenibacillus senegalimassiliensis]|uniref:hypothetical protein n=1 Tax=Paenibacillus senegalimassiliensis TaxID=1737426 RepID=UPI00073F5B02|nr:hypothetical protein [Paenibacillus senegalimassiliensis]
MKAAEFDNKLLPDQPYSFIVHLFDRLLLGTTHDEREYSELLRALDEDRVLEGHFFDGTQEIYIARQDGQLIAYEPIVVDKTEDAEHAVIQRSYELEQAPYNTVGAGKARYTGLTVRERIAYEDDLAYVERTMLCCLEKGEAQ